MSTATTLIMTMMMMMMTRMANALAGRGPRSTTLLIVLMKNEKGRSIVVLLDFPVMPTWMIMYILDNPPQNLTASVAGLALLLLLPLLLIVLLIVNVITMIIVIINIVIAIRVVSPMPTMMMT